MEEASSFQIRKGTGELVLSTEGDSWFSVVFYLFGLEPAEFRGRLHCFPGNSDSKESACHAGDLGSTPGLGSSPGEGNGNPL